MIFDVFLLVSSCTQCIWHCPLHSPKVTFVYNHELLGTHIMNIIYTLKLAQTLIKRIVCCSNILSCNKLSDSTPIIYTGSYASCSRYLFHMQFGFMLKMEVPCALICP